MKILSLFNGMGCIWLALDKLGIKVNGRYSSEIDKYANIVNNANYPDTKQLGDVRDVSWFDLPRIDLLVGGSPCQGFSFAGKQLNFDDERSKLFFEFVRLLKELEPKYFLLENVKMKKESQDVISKYLGVEPIEINSALVSAQNRRRLYWTNIPGVEQPVDKGILLKDILEDRSRTIGRVVGRKINPLTSKRDDYNPELKAKQRFEPRFDNKCGTLTTVQKDNVVLVPTENPVKFTKNYLQWDSNGKRQCRQRERAYYQEGKHGTLLSSKTDDKTKVLLTPRNKSKCVRASGRGSLDRHEWDSVDNNHYRKLTPTECERLQTVPDNYTNYVSNSQRYKMLGNGWTVDVIAHILKGIT